MKLGVDFSAGIPSAATIDCWKAQGVEYAVVQYDAPVEFQAQMRAIANAGFELQVYVYEYFPLSPWGQTPEDRIRACLNFIQGFPVTRVWVDVEGGTLDSPANVVAAMERCVSLIENAGYNAGIYTARFVYHDMTGNSQRFKHLPLWDARYISQSPQANLSLTPKDMGGFIPYGGWTEPEIWQWHNTTVLCGHSVDINVRGEVVSEPPIEEDDDMKAHHAWASFFTGRVYGPSTEIHTAQIRTDFTLPADAKAVMFQPILSSGTVEFFHGGTEMPVANVGSKTFIGNLDEAGTLKFRTKKGCKFKELKCVGYFR